MYEFVITWIRYDLPNRQQYVPQLMANIRFANMRKEYLVSLVENEVLINTNLQCAQSIYEAHKFPSLYRPRLSLFSHLLIAGGDRSFVEMFDLRNGQSQPVADMPMLRIKYEIIVSMFTNPIF